MRLIYVWVLIHGCENRWLQVNRCYKCICYFRMSTSSGSVLVHFQQILPLSFKNAIYLTHTKEWTIFILFFRIKRTWNTFILLFVFFSSPREPNNLLYSGKDILGEKVFQVNKHKSNSFNIKTDLLNRQMDFVLEKNILLCIHKKWKVPFDFL